MNIPKEACPICQHQNFEEFSFAMEIEHQENTVMINNLVASHCEKCKETLTSPEQLRRNLATISKKNAL